MAVSSSKCKNLSSPYVLISFDIREIDGSLSHHSAELSYEQFKVLNYGFWSVYCSSCQTTHFTHPSYLCYAFATLSLSQDFQASFERVAVTMDGL